MKNELKYSAIVKYVGDSAKINNAIRTKCTDDITKGKIDKIIKELASFPRNNNSTVFRNDHIIVWKEVYKFYNYFKGKVIKRPEFLNVFQENKKTRKINLIIKTSSKSNCVDLRPAFLEPNKKDNGDKVRMESHGIFLPNTNFYVIDIDNKNEIVYLEETIANYEFCYTYDKMYSFLLKNRLIKPKKVNLSAGELGLI